MMNKIIKIKKNLRNNIIGSLLLGNSIAITMQTQASQRLFPPSEREIREARENKKRVAEAEKKRAEEERTCREKEAFERKKRVTEELKNELASKKPLSMDEHVISLVRGGVSGNVDCGNFTFLEEAILSQSWKGVRAAIENRARVENISKFLKECHDKGFTLLHLAVLLPEEMRELCQLKRIGKEKSLENPHASSDVMDELLKAFWSRDIMAQVLELVKNNVTKINDPNMKKEYEAVAKSIAQKIDEMTPPTIGIPRWKADELLQEGHEAVQKYIKTNAKEREETRKQRLFEERISKKA
ncbi:MAG: hypothetical protein LBD60_03490 [Puniceicoccales bacterium]|jgi:hypothetical protein|nr:hypothetical protein [Puniceicoccales bacterium]